MRNIKKILMVTLLLCMAIAATVAFSSCETDATPHVHEFAETVVTEATCTEEGVINCTCACGYKTTKEIPAKGHTEVVDAAVPAECTKPGLTAGSHCETCGIVIESQSAIMPLGHAMGAEATCTEDQVCENGCGLVYAPATGHLVTGVATCTESADCVICGEAVVEALGHSIVIVPGIPVTCLTNGVSDGEYCDRCHVVLAEQEIVYATNHAVTGVVTEPTCTAEGYTTYTCLCGLKNYDDDFVEPIGHDWNTEAYEVAVGFEKLCGNDCGLTKPAATPVADSYEANINNGYSSDRANELIIDCGPYGSWGLSGLAAAGPYHSTEYPNGIGKFDKNNLSVKYEFVISEDGCVDIRWHIASSAWNGTTNGGIANMASNMVITIDGKPVDIDGLALPAGAGTSYEIWWNLFDFVIEDVALEAGVHTFECRTITSGGLNIGYMSISSNRELSVREAKVEKVDLVQLNNNIYYDVYVDLKGYTVNDIKNIDGDVTYALDSTFTADGLTVLRYNVTNLESMWPHLVFDGQNYVNGVNYSGDMTGFEFVTQSIIFNNKEYKVAEKYGMPVLTVATASAKILGSDLTVIDGKACWIFNYDVAVFPLDSFTIVGDAGVVYPHTVQVRDDGTVDFIIVLNDLPAGNLYPHLYVNGAPYTGEGSTGNSGDMYTTNFPNPKKVAVGGKEFKIYKPSWNMTALEIVEDTKAMVIDKFDLIEKDGRVYYVLTYSCMGYDENTEVQFFDGDTIFEYTAVRDGDQVTFYFDVTDRTSDLYNHLRVWNGTEWVKWDGINDTTSSNGDVKSPYHENNNKWNTIITLKASNGRQYVINIRYQMILLGF